MRIDSDDTKPAPRDELRQSQRRQRQQRQSQLKATPDWRVLAAVGLAILLMMGAFLLGRNSTATDPPEPQDPSRVLVADVLGSAEVEATVPFADGTNAVVACSPIETADGTRADVRVIHIGPNGAGEQILSYRHLAEVASCGACTTDRVQLANEAMLVGHCDFNSDDDGGQFPNQMQSSSAFVISSPAPSGQSAIGMDLFCGITGLQVDENQLVLEASQPIFRGNPNRPAPLPPMRFTRENGEFVADDAVILEHFCTVTPDTQLVAATPPLWFWQPKPELSYLETDSEIGRIGFRNAVLIGLTEDQCNTLLVAQAATTNTLAEAVTLASITGLEPPEEYDDWFFTCQIESDLSS